MVAAHHPVVAVLANHYRIGLTWLSAARSVAGQPTGRWGPVDNAAVGASSWAAFFCEYSHLMGSGAVLERALPPQSNFARGRDLRHSSSAGSTVTVGSPDERMRVRQVAQYRFFEYMSVRFRRARLDGATRLRYQRPAARLVHMAGSLLLPPWLVAKVTLRVMRARRNRITFLLVLPLVVLYTFPWAAGNLVGTMAGKARRRIVE